jgi:hypothetical protein
MTANSDALKAFAALLAAEPDPAKRNRLIKQATMLALNEAPPEAFEPPIRTLEDYLLAEIALPPVLIHPYLCVRGGLNVTVGRAGFGKTVMNLNRMLRWSAGLPWVDGWVDKHGEKMLAPDKPLRILIVENEGAAGMFHKQVGDMLASERHLPGEAVDLAKQNILIWGEGGYSNMKLDDPNILAGLRQGVEKWEPDLVFIEPFRSLWKGEENSATEMNVVVDALVGLATDYNCGVWAAHHEKKGGAGEDDKMSAARGSTVLEGVVTVMENWEKAKSGDFREMTWSKSRHGVAPNPQMFKWDHDAWWYDMVPSDQVNEDIYGELKGNPDEAMTKSELSEALDYPPHKLEKALREMVESGKIKRMASVPTANGSSGYRYRLPTGGDDSSGGLSIG